MSDIKLFKINGAVSELEGKTVALEKSLQQLLEDQLEAFLGVRFLSSEHSTGQTHQGRIDTLGIDENGWCNGEGSTSKSSKHPSSKWGYTAVAIL